MPNPGLWAAAFLAAAGSSFALSLFVRYLVTRTNDLSVRILWMIAWFIGATLGYGIMQAMPRIPPFSALDRWLVLGAPLVMIVAIVAHSREKATWWRRLLPMGCSVLLPFILLHRSIYVHSGFGALETWLWLGGSAAVFAMLDLSNEMLLRRTDSWSIALSLASALLATGTMVLFGGYIRGGIATLPWCGGLCGLTAALLLGTSKCDVAGIGRAVSRVAIMSLVAWVGIGYCFGELSWFRAIAVLAVPVLHWVPELWGLGKLSPWHRRWLRVSLVGVVLVGLVWSAKRDFDRKFGEVAAAQKVFTELEGS